ASPAGAARTSALCCSPITDDGKLHYAGRAGTPTPLLPGGRDGLDQEQTAAALMWSASTCPRADKAGAALAALRLTRSGGHLWQSAEMEAELSARGVAAVGLTRG